MNGAAMMILLDTHIFVRLAAGAPLKEPDLYEQDELVVSAISAAEIACLVQRGRLGLDKGPDVWFTQAASRMGAHVLDLEPGTLARSFLLQWSHSDPADRVLVQILRENVEYVLHTRDAKLVRYCHDNGLRVFDCR